MKRTTFYIFCLMAVLTAPLTLNAIIIAKGKMDRPTVHMIYHSKEVVKIVDKDGDELEWTDNLSQFPHGYNVVWVDPETSLDQYLK